MVNPRTYGPSSRRIALVHGGPGAPGEMAPVAHELSAGFGVLEPLQTADTVEGQIAELRRLLHAGGNPPLVLVGYSWGAWLALLAAADEPDLVRKIILVGSGPFEERFVPEIEATRRARMSPADRAELAKLERRMAEPGAGRAQDFSRFGEIYARADDFDPLPDELGGAEFQPDIYRAVWPAAAELRRSGALLAAVRQVRCPVVAIHGDYDPHPAVGVSEPLMVNLPDFTLHLLPQCGHTPWIERRAREAFYALLRREIAEAV